MTARSRWAIGVSAIAVVIIGVAFLGTTRDRNSVQARGGSSAVGTVVFASPGRVEGASETTQVGAATDGILKAVYVKEGQMVRMTLYAYAGRTFEGRVKKIYDKADADRRTFEVDVDMVEKEPTFSAGMTGELAFVMAEKASAGRRTA